MRRASSEAALLGTSCRTDAGWKVGRVTVRSQPTQPTPGAPPPAPLYDDVDSDFLRATCAP